MVYSVADMPPARLLWVAGFFPDLPWEPANLRFLLVACHLYHSLVSHQDGLMLLQVPPTHSEALHTSPASTRPRELLP